MSLLFNRHMPLFWLLLIGYFLLISGVFYNLLNDPPSIGHYTDPKTNKNLPAIFYMNDFKEQYVLEGLVSSFFCCLGCVGFIVLDYAQLPSISRKQRLMAYIFSGVTILMAFFMTRTFFRVKTKYLTDTF